MIRLTVWIDVEAETSVAAREIVRSIVTRAVIDEDQVHDWGIAGAEVVP